MIGGELVVAVKPYQVYAGMRELTTTNAEHATHYGLAIGKMKLVLLAEKNGLVRVEFDNLDLPSHVADRVGKLHKDAELGVAMRIRRGPGGPYSIEDADQVDIAPIRIR